MPPAMAPRKVFFFCLIISSFIQTLTVGTVVATVLPFYRLADFTAGRGLHPALKIISGAKIVKKTHRLRGKVSNITEPAFCDNLEYSIISRLLMI